jgi:hydroxymethylbilane synthase
MSSAQPLRIGTRGSALALFQAHAVAAALWDRAGVACNIVVIKTSGDRLAEVALADSGGKRLFVKEIEDALAQGAIDLAVHSSKDMPAELPPGLAIGAVLAREDARDVLVLPIGAEPLASLESLKATLGRAGRIGTSSVRRMAQLAHFAPTASFAPIRGNLDTRLRKVDAGEYDALVLAAAGLMRLNHADRIAAFLPLEVCVPAPGQGIIAVEVRSGDAGTGTIVPAIDDVSSRAALEAERAVVSRLGGGCQMPIGAHAAVSHGALSIAAAVTSLDGVRSFRVDVHGETARPQAAGVEAAEQLLALGAGEVLGNLERLLDVPDEPIR